jgi:hypothetical protein
MNIAFLPVEHQTFQATKRKLNVEFSRPISKFSG